MWIVKQHENPWSRTLALAREPLWGPSRRDANDRFEAFSVFSDHTLIAFGE